MSALDSVCQWMLILLANALWQVALIGGIALAILRFGRVTSPQWRYAICVGALAAIMTCPLATAVAPYAGLSLVQWQWRVAKIAPAPEAVAAPAAVAGRAAAPVEARAKAAPAPAVTEAMLEETGFLPLPHVPSQARRPAIAASTVRIEAPAPVRAAPPSPRIPGPWRWLVLGYGLGLFAMVARLGVGQLRQVSLCRSAQPAPGELNAMLDRLSDLARLRAKVRIRVSDQIAAPVLIGLARPTILIPSAMARLSPLDLEVILLHELAHVSRRDLLVNLLQRLTKSVLFFHPVVWILNREMRMQREHCCDAWVIGRTGRDVDYARCLAELARALVAAHVTVPGLAMAHLRHELSRRVAAVLDGSTRRGRSLPRWAFALILGVAFAVAAVVGTCGLTAEAQAQEGQTLAEMTAAMNVNDTLAGDATASPADGHSPAGAPLPADPRYPATSRAIAPAAPAPVAGSSPTPTGQILVLTGQRMTCPITGALLEDYHYEYRPESEKSEYFDDGTNGDLVANDNIWTRYVERDDALSPTGNHLKRTYLRMLKMIETTHAVDFFSGAQPTTNDPVSKLPRTHDEQRDRDEQYIRRWHREFLASYRRDPEDPASDFHPIFVPDPPRPPATPSPPEQHFSPTAYALDAFIQQTVQGATVPLRQPAVEESNRTRRIVR